MLFMSNSLGDPHSTRQRECREEQALAERGLGLALPANPDSGACEVPRPLADEINIALLAVNSLLH